MSAEHFSASRRSILEAGLGLTLMSAAPVTLAQDSGAPPVWLGMTQDELDNAYAQGPWAPNWEAVWSRYTPNSEAAISRLGEPQSFEYGESPDDTLEVHAAEGAARPIHIFVHGGAWFTGSAREYAFLAETFVNAGAHFVAVNHSSVEDTDGRLEPLADQIRRAIRWIYRNAGKFDGDPEEIYLSGHSSGAHLAGVALATDWAGRYDLPADLLKGGICISGMFDLEPVSLSSRRDYVAFSEDTVSALSPQRHIENLEAPLLIAVGSLEGPEFRRQSREFAAAVREKGKPVELIIAEHYNHFEILETLANPYGILGRAALEQMGLV